MNNKLAKTFLIITLLLAAVLRFIYLAQIQSNPLPFFIIKWSAFDQHSFMKLVNEFVKGNWLGSEVTRYSPAYSYLMAALFKIFGQNINVVFVFQILLGLVAIYVFYKIAVLLFNNKKVGLLAACIAALYSPLIFYECIMLRAVIIAYSNLLGFYFLLKAIKKDRIKCFFIAGIMIGISMIIRPNILPLFIMPYIFIVIKKTYKQKLFYTLLFILGLIVIISPLTLRNKMLGKNVLISFQGPSAFWVGNTYITPGIGLTADSVREQLSKEAQGSIAKTVKILLREIKRHPQEYRSLYLRKIKMFFNAYEIPANLSYDLFKENHNILKISFFNFGIVCPLAILGIFLTFRRYNYVGLLYLFLSVPSFSTIAFHIQGRYRMPVVPFFIILSAYTIYWFAYTIKEKRFPALGCAFIAFIALSFYTKPDEKIIKKYFGGPVRSIDYRNLTIAYVQKSNEEGLQENEKEELLKKAADNLDKARATSFPTR